MRPVRKQINCYDFATMRNYVIINTFRYKSRAMDTFDFLYAVGAYKDIINMVERLGAEVVETPDPQLAWRLSYNTKD